MKKLKGKVIRGRGIGKQFTVPTANIQLDKNYKTPEPGVYSGSVFLKNKKYKAAIFIGPRLTFNLSNTSIEAAIIDFNGDLYNNKIELEIRKKIRNIKKFSSKENLKKQILKDMASVISNY
jgi:riboflavin kinase/FMN adenylyltransferase